MAKINFDEQLKTRDGKPIHDQSFERTMIAQAERIKEGGGRSLASAAQILDQVGFKFSSIAEIVGTPLTLRTICVDSLDVELEVDERTGRPKLTGSQRRDKDRLASKIYGTKEPIELSNADIEQIKTAIERRFSSNLIYGQVCDLLEGKKSEE